MTRLIPTPPILPNPDTGAPGTHPSERPVGASARQRRAARLPGNRILLVDDHHESADAMSTMLTQFGNTVRTVYDGQHALTVFEAWRPEVVVLDLGMPGLDGFQVARCIRALPAGRRTLIIALTGFSSRLDRQQSVAAGIDHHSVKPVDAIILQRVIEVQLAEKRASPAQRHRKASAANAVMAAVTEARSASPDRSGAPDRPDTADATNDTTQEEADRAFG